MNETNTLAELLKTTEECIALLDSDVHDKVRDSLNRFKSKGVLVYENHDLTSNTESRKYWSYLIRDQQTNTLIGHRFAIGYGGTENTIQEVVDNRCKVTSPLGYAWQYYLIAYSEDQDRKVIQ